MGTGGLWMLLATAIVMAASGLPAWLVLIGTSLAFAALGLAFGALSLPFFSALPSRLLGLLDNDLLQALPLYVLIGAMLNRLPLAEILFRAGNRLLRRTAAAPYLTGLGLGALLAPMNGSVGASISMLAHTVQPRLDAQHAPAERSAALICAAGTIGVVVPPSLVLILLGDAMLRAHTEAVNATGQATRIINTQDIFHGALVPAALILLLFVAVTWWRNRSPHAAPADTIDVPRTDWIVAACSVAGVGALLVAITLGYLYAVEGAATGGLALLLFGLGARTLTRPVLGAILRDTLAVTGTLFALLVAATTYTLVLRAFGTDAWVAAFLKELGGGSGALAAVLLILAASAFLLDAFEIIFVIVPIVMPPLLTLVPDAIWVAVLTLVVLQASFLIPPFGYAVLMVGSALRRKLAQRALAGALWPYLFVQVIVLLSVLAWPGLVWHSHPATSAQPALSDEQVQELLRQQPLNDDLDASPAPKKAGE